MEHLPPMRGKGIDHLVVVGSVITDDWHHLVLNLPIGQTLSHNVSHVLPSVTFRCAKHINKTRTFKVSNVDLISHV